MLAVVKVPRTNRRRFEIKGDIPNRVVDYLRSEFGRNFTVVDGEEDRYVDITDTQWYQKQKKRMTPGHALKIYRERDKLTQGALGRRLGGLSRQKVSDMENNRRGISKELAKKLADIFGTSVEKFL